MPYIYFNPNPSNIRVGDCSVRAICKVLELDWEDAYVSLCAEGLMLHDMPSANYVWGMLLHKNGFREHIIPNICPNCTTVSSFAEEHPDGTYVLATQNHTVAVCDGCWWDSWDSGGEITLYYYEKED